MLLTFVLLAGAVAAAGVMELDSGGDSPAVALPTWRSTYDWAGGDGSSGWGPRPLAADADAYGLLDGQGGDAGLWVWPRGDRRYAPGGAGWRLTAPGTTRIARAIVDVTAPARLFSHHCVRATLTTGGETRDAVETCKPQKGSPTMLRLHLADPSPRPTTKHLDVRIEVPACRDSGLDACGKWIPVARDTFPGDALHVRAADLVLVDDDDPVVVASQGFYALDGTYIDGRRTYPLQIDADDAGSGVTRIDIDHSGWPGPQPPLAEHAVTCDPHHRTPSLGSRICPAHDQLAIVVDTRPMPEGTRHFRAHTPDVAANVGERRWTVIIDRTPPTPPKDINFTTPEEGSAQPTWNAADDPVLPDRTPGSGVAHYRERHRIGDGEWSAWQEQGADARRGEEVYDQPAGTQVEFEVEAVDAVGNASEPVRVSGAVYGSPPVVSLSGRIADLADDYIGSEQAVLTVTASDDGVGVARLWAGRDGGDDLGDVDAGCTPRTRPDGSPWKALCPASASHEFGVDTGALPEGAVTLTAAAVDRAHNRSADVRVTVLIDHTAPPAPTNITLDPIADAGVAEVNWDQGDDPVLADGQPGSGVGSSRIRYQRPDGSWSDWADDADNFAVPGVSPGDAVQIQAQAIDDVDNASDVVTQTVTVGDDTPFTDEELAQFSLENPTWADLMSSDGYDDVEPLDPDQHLVDPSDAELGMSDSGNGAAPRALASAAASGPAPCLTTIYARAYYRDAPTASAAAGGETCPAPMDPLKKSKKKRKKFSCTELLRKALGRRRAAQYCKSDEDTWTYVYRLIDPRTRRAFYVGEVLERNWDVRCATHMRTYGLPSAKFCQRLEIVPNKAVAVSVEQALIEAYGFGPRRLAGKRPVTNWHYGSPLFVWTTGWLSGKAPVLANGRRNFSAKYLNMLYCVPVALGFTVLQAAPPWLADRYPYSTRFWWPNFAARTCFPPGVVEDAYKLMEYPKTAVHEGILG